MIRQVATLCFFLVCHSCQADDHVEGTKATEKEHSAVSPAVNKADAKFFGKDYPWDKRPRVDVLHFKHPYPIVQDSDDYDKDFVKDDNKDDGSYAAQSEYDRLRHKLAKEKADVAKSLKKKNHAENELQDAMKRERLARKKAADAAAAAAAKAAGSVSGSEGTKKEKTPLENTLDRVISRIPGGISSSGAVRVATDDTQRAMDALEECKKQLKDARESLKKLMDEFEEAKKQQSKTQAELDSDSSRKKELDSAKEASSKGVKSSYQEYMDAREAYLKQQALVAKMEADIKDAASKVKSSRDAEDKSGGVYNTDSGDGKSRFPGLRSAAHSSMAPLTALVLAASVTVACLAN